MRSLRPALLIAGVWKAFVLAQEEDDETMPEGHGEEMEMGDADEVPELGVEPEWQALTAERFTAIFKKIDLNSDGKIPVDELHLFSRGMNTKRAEQAMEHILEDSDTNKDGKVSLEEIMADQGNLDDDVHQDLQKLKFTAADKDKDGFLDKREAALFMHPDSDPEVEAAMAQGELQRRDTNKDGKLDIKEFYTLEVSSDLEEGEKQEFALLDKNGDNFLDAKEIQAFESGRHHQERMLISFVETADANKDGFVTLAEALEKREDMVEHDAGFQFDDWAHMLEL